MVTDDLSPQDASFRQTSGQPGTHGRRGNPSTSHRNSYYLTHSGTRKIKDLATSRHSGNSKHTSPSIPVLQGFAPLPPHFNSLSSQISALCAVMLRCLPIQVSASGASLESHGQSANRLPVWRIWVYLFRLVQLLCPVTAATRGIDRPCSNSQLVPSWRRS